MKTAYNNSKSIETSADSKRNALKLAGLVALIGAVGVAGVVTKNHIAETMDENIGNAVHEQVTGFDKSDNTYEKLQTGVIDLQVPAIDINNRTK